MMKPKQDQRGEKKRLREELSPPNTPSSRPAPNKMTKSEEEEVSLSDVIGELRIIRGSIERLEQSMEARMTAVEKDVQDMKVSMGKMSEEVTEIVREEINRENDKMKSELNEIKLEAKKLEVFRADAREQADKKDSVIVMGVKEEDGESDGSLVTTVQALGKIIGVDIKKADVKSVRRAGKKRINQKNRGVVVTLCPDKKKLVMAKKSSLKDKSAELSEKNKFESKVMIFDDLTETRRKLLKTTKEAEEVDFAYVKEGKILAKLKARQQFVKIENADDLIHIGVNSVNYSDFYRNFNNE